MKQSFKLRAIIEFDYPDISNDEFEDHLDKQMMEQMEEINWKDFVPYISTQGSIKFDVELHKDVGMEDCDNLLFRDRFITKIK